MNSEQYNAHVNNTGIPGDALRHLESHPNLIDWSTLPVNNKTIVLFSKFRLGKDRIQDDDRWLESDEWLDMCNDMSTYDN